MKEREDVGRLPLASSSTSLWDTFGLRAHLCDSMSHLWCSPLGTSHQPSSSRAQGDQWVPARRAFRAHDDDWWEIPKKNVKVRHLAYRPPWVKPWKSSTSLWVTSWNSLLVATGVPGIRVLRPTIRFDASERQSPSATNK